MGLVWLLVILVVVLVLVLVLVLAIAALVKFPSRQRKASKKTASRGDARRPVSAGPAADVARPTCGSPAAVPSQVAGPVKREG